MKSLRNVAVAALLSFGSVQAATDDVKWSYLSNGADWVLLKGTTECDKTNQSPIDLRTQDHYNPFKMANGNEFKKEYTNFVAKEIGNFGNTIKVVFPKGKDGDDGDVPENWFESDFAQKALGSDEKFTAAQFHFHAASEHTINGKRYDFEMHTVHLPKEPMGVKDGQKIIASATGLIFDTVDYDTSISAEDRKIIDKFFDSLNLESLPPTAAKGHKLASDAEVPFADLMKIVNFANRWVYVGSLTTPPCSVGVLHQVMDRVLPISPKHLNLYKKHQHQHDQVEYTVVDKTATNGYKVMTDATNTPMDITGNWRETQKIDKHNVTYMRVDFDPQAAGDHETTTIVIAILLVVSVILTAVLAFLAVKFNRQLAQKASMEGGAVESAFNTQRKFNE